MTETVTLIFSWSYKAYGQNRNRCIENPVCINGTSKKTFTYPSNKTITEYLNYIKIQMVEYVKEINRQTVFDIWMHQYKCENETIGSESVKIKNVQQATMWSDLEDY